MVSEFIVRWRTREVLSIGFGHKTSSTTSFAGKADPRGEVWVRERVMVNSWDFSVPLTI